MPEAVRSGGAAGAVCLASVLGPRVPSWFAWPASRRGSPRHGHAAGDAVLREVAERLLVYLPQGTLGRIGGEEFAAFFEGTYAEAVEACQNAVEAVRAEPVLLDSGAEVRVTISGGLCRWRPAGKSRDYSLGLTHEEADQALYAAKRAGRDRLVVVDEMADAA